MAGQYPPCGKFCLRAAEAVAEELPNLVGEVLRLQQLRVKELLRTGNEQNEAYMRLHGKPDASQIIHSAAGANGRVDKQASSPGGKRDKSVNSGRDKRLERYDPALVEK